MKDWATSLGGNVKFDVKFRNFESMTKAKEKGHQETFARIFLVTV